MWQNAYRRRPIKNCASACSGTGTASSATTAAQGKDSPITTFCIVVAGAETPQKILSCSARNIMQNDTE